MPNRKSGLEGAVEKIFSAEVRIFEWTNSSKSEKSGYFDFGFYVGQCSGENGDENFIMQNFKLESWLAFWIQGGCSCSNHENSC